MGEFNIVNHCHVNSNEDGDRFVGVKIDSDDVMVYFPIGYDLPTDENEIRTDIKHLIRVLSEFTDVDTRLLAANNHGEKTKVEFPINAYRAVIDYYFSIGGRYYIETDPVYKKAPTGKQDWPKTVKNHMPLIQRKNGKSSFVFTDFTVRTITPNDTKLITQINRFCVYEAFKRIGWIYTDYMPEQPGAHPDVKTSIAIVRSKLSNTNDDKKRTLFQAMIDMLMYLDEPTSAKYCYYGTDEFEIVWERMIDKAFGVKKKEEYFPKSRWLLDYGQYKEKHPLMPDSIMIWDDKYYVLDAKCYRYGHTGIPDHLPNGSSINKQITYGEYLEKYKGINTDYLFNAFIMPYNMSDNPFELTGEIENVGEAIGDWRFNRKYYERIQGIVIDTRFMMYNYAGRPLKAKAELAESIEKVVCRPAIE